MRTLKRQFGAHFASLAAASPSLTADIARLRKRKVRIRRLANTIDAYCIKGERLIAIGTGEPVHTQVVNLAHEANHMLRERVSFDAIDSLPKARFVSLCMKEETDCFLREIEVAKELKEAGIPLTKYSRRWCRIYRRGGRRAVARAVARSKVVTTRLLYPQYYAQLYDDFRTK
ncbi:MAG TPA: hypothetical protein V6D17_13310 [Candidatus Obscuribacterales bacterium]